MTELQPVYRKDYRQPDYWIESVDLHFLLDEDGAIVRSQMQCVRNESSSAGAPLVLDGEEMKLLSVAINSEPLEESQYTVDDEHLTIQSPPERFQLEVSVRICPQTNKSMEGLYQSSGNFCTQCEAEGFRRITYFLDRPDVMAKYTTTIEADPTRYPVMLSNGNRVAEGEGESGRRWVRWEDPFPKPTYLFALVAGKLECHRGQFTTRSGRTVELEIWVEPQNLDACKHALQSLKKSMQWDEEVFGLEYDLDLYMIVAVGDFNMGAMENKGLNIFNTKYVLARPDTATDDDFDNIERVVAHEYFHNWTGNRVTCRDWFQLTLKEGLTVFRDQLFSADMGSAPVNRIRDVRSLRGSQFAEDDGPMAHPIRPEQYVEMNNFYTATVYYKGAEVVRMYRTLLGPEGFRRGMDLYFERHDNSAVECDDFRAAMADANGVDLTQFERWYSQAGTPVVEARGEYNQAEQIYTLHLKQSLKPTAGLDNSLPMHIPVCVGLVGPEGDLAVSLNDADAKTEHLLELRESEESFRFSGVTVRPAASVLRNFSAPVRLVMDRSLEELAFLLGHDSDAFNRWDAGQELAVRVLLSLVGQAAAKQPLTLDAGIVEAFRQVLSSEALDDSMKALAITLPSEKWIGQQMETVDVDAIHAAKQFAVRQIADQLREPLESVYSERSGQAYSSDADAVASRRLKNVVLSYLAALESPETTALAATQFDSADNMTDSQAALMCLGNIDCPERASALKAFYERWSDSPLVIDKWFGVQATSQMDGVVQEVQRLTTHQDFHIENPNRVRSLLGMFAQNQFHFHHASGAGYELIADKVLEIDPSNAQVAASLVSNFNAWRRFDSARQEMMRVQLQRIADQPGLSKDVGEIVGRSLGR